VWIMTGFGILMPAVRPAKTVALGDDRTMQIRARRARDLDTLRAQYMQGTLGPTIHTPDKDYEYRAYCAPAAFALAMANAIAAIDYLKFKPITLDRYQDRELHSTYNGIWSVVSRDLSTVAHQRAYWHSVRPAKGRPPAGEKPATAGVDLSRPTGTGWAGFAEYPAAGEQYTLPAAHRGSSAVRDEYVPEVWDDAVAETGDAYLDALYVEIDDLERALGLGYVTHENCNHSSGAGARSRCQRRRLGSWRARLAQCRVLVDQYYDELTALFAGAPTPVAESSDEVTVVEGEVSTG
jgi:hypothetical protein